MANYLFPLSFCYVINYCLSLFLPIPAIFLPLTPFLSLSMCFSPVFSPSLPFSPIYFPLLPSFSFFSPPPLPSSLSFSLLITIPPLLSLLFSSLSNFLPSLFPRESSQILYSVSFLTQMKLHHKSSRVGKN